MMKHRRRPRRPAPRSGSVEVRAVSEVPASLLAGSALVLLALAAVALVKNGASDGGLANTGSPVNAVTIGLVALLLVAGVALVIIGQSRKKRSDGKPDEGGTE